MRRVHRRRREKVVDIFRPEGESIIQPEQILCAKLSGTALEVCESKLSQFLACTSKNRVSPRAPMIHFPYDSMVDTTRHPYIL